jgi:hypothetical protein
MNNSKTVLTLAMKQYTLPHFFLPKSNGENFMNLSIVKVISWVVCSCDVMILSQAPHLLVFRWSSTLVILLTEKVCVGGPTPFPQKPDLSNCLAFEEMMLVICVFFSF